MKSFQLYTSFKFDIQKLVDSMLAPYNPDSNDAVDLPHDIYVHEKKMRIEVEIPGVDESNLEIEGCNQCIRISGVKNTIKSRYPSCVALERSAGKFKNHIPGTGRQHAAGPGEIGTGSSDDRDSRD